MLTVPWSRVSGWGQPKIGPREGLVFDPLSGVLQVGLDSLFRIGLNGERREGECFVGGEEGSVLRAGEDGEWFGREWGRMLALHGEKSCSRGFDSCLSIWLLAST